MSVVVQCTGQWVVPKPSWWVDMSWEWNDCAEVQPKTKFKFKHFKLRKIDASTCRLDK